MALDGCRLTAGYHLTEDQESIRELASIRRKTKVVDLSKGRGVFRGSIFRRMFAAGPEFGQPYVSASDLVQLDIRPDGWLSASHGKLLDELRLRDGMILVTCSGMNLGRAIWGWPGISGLCASHDLIRIEPDAEKVPPGYLFAFLASRYGRVSIRRQIYGGNIKHVEPHHVSGISVPRLSAQLEDAAHRAVLESARLRGLAVAERLAAIRMIETWLGWGAVAQSPAYSVRGASLLSRRMDAHFHRAPSVRARNVLESGTQQRVKADRLGDVVEEVFEPNRGARMQVTDPVRGVPFLSSSQVFRLDPVGEYLISRRTPHLSRLIVSDRDILVPRSGQRGGIIGRAARPFDTYVGSAASEHLVRVRCRSSDDANWYFAVLASEPGYLALLGTAYGSSIPSLDCELISDLRIARPPTALREEVARKSRAYAQCAARAALLEREAIGDVEREIARRARG
jgi:type I restriction enzyme S subunit